MCGASSPSGRLTVAVWGPGDALVMRPAEGDSWEATKELAAGPVSLPPGIKAGNILPFNGFWQPLELYWRTWEVIGAKEGCSTGSTKRTEQKETEFKYVRVRYYACVQLPSMPCAWKNWVRQDSVLNLVVTTEKSGHQLKAVRFSCGRKGIIIFFWNLIYFLYLCTFLKFFSHASKQ